MSSLKRMVSFMTSNTQYSKLIKIKSYNSLIITKKCTKCFITNILELADDNVDYTGTKIMKLIIKNI